MQKKSHPSYCPMLSDQQKQIRNHYYLKEPLHNLFLSELYVCPCIHALSTRGCSVQRPRKIQQHNCDVTMGTNASQITSLTVVYSTVYSGADQRKHKSSASLAFVRGIHRRPVNSPHKWPVTRKMFPFDDVIMICYCKSIALKPKHYCKI